MNFENECRLMHAAVEDLKHSEAWDSFELLRERVELIISRFGPNGQRAQQKLLERAEIAVHHTTVLRKYQTIVQFEKNGAGDFQAIPEVLFKPMGLLLWGTDESTRLLDLRVGIQPQFITTSPTQAMKFESSKTVEELEELAKLNKLAWPGEEYLLTECDSAMPGNYITLRYEGALRDAALWGYGLK